MICGVHVSCQEYQVRKRNPQYKSILHASSLHALLPSLCFLSAKLRTMRLQSNDAQNRMENLANSCKYRHASTHPFAWTRNPCLLKHSTAIWGKVFRFILLHNWWNKNTSKIFWTSLDSKSFDSASIGIHQLHLNWAKFTAACGTALGKWMVSQSQPLAISSEAFMC